jgi:hypothetical protein
MDYPTRTEAVKKWLEWDDKSEAGQERFRAETNWMPIMVSGQWDLIFTLKGP